MGKEKRSWRPVPVQPSFPLGPGDTIITPTSLLSYFYLFVAIAFLLYIVSGLEADRNFGDTVNTFHDLPFGQCVMDVVGIVGMVDTEDMVDI